MVHLLLNVTWKLIGDIIFSIHDRSVNREKNMCSFVFRCLLFLTTEFLPFLCGETTVVSVFLIMPDRASLNKKLKNSFSEAWWVGKRELQRSQQYPDYILKESTTIIDQQNPQDILDLFCETIFKSHVNTILYFQLHPTKDPTPNYIIDMAEYLRIPVISWDSEYPGALQVGSMVALTITIIAFEFY